MSAENRVSNTEFVVMAVLVVMGGIVFIATKVHEWRAGAPHDLSDPALYDLGYGCWDAKLFFLWMGLAIIGIIWLMIHEALNKTHPVNEI